MRSRKKHNESSTMNAENPLHIVVNFTGSIQKSDTQLLYQGLFRRNTNKWTNKIATQFLGLINSENWTFWSEDQTDDISDVSCT